MYTKMGVLTQEDSCPDLPLLFRRSSELELLEARTWHCQDLRGSVLPELS